MFSNGMAPLPLPSYSRNRRCMALTMVKPSKEIDGLPDNSAFDRDQMFFKKHTSIGTLPDIPVS